MNKRPTPIAVRAGGFLSAFAALLSSALPPLLSLALPCAAVRAEESVRLGTLATARREWSRAEVRSTFDLWTRELGARFQMPVTVTHYDDAASMRRDFLSGRINGVNTDAMTLVRHFKPEELGDGFATIMKGGWNLMLFAGRHVPLAGLDDLDGKRIVLLEDSEVGDLYLETLCLRHRRRACKAVFSEVQRVSTNNQALMRVFFGKADLALVHGYGHAVSVEMNPQLGQALRLIAERPLYSLYFAFYSAGTDKAFQQRTLGIIPDMHTYPRGRQLLDIFKMERLEVTDPSRLTPFAQLEREYQELRNEQRNEQRTPHGRKGTAK